MRCSALLALILVAPTATAVAAPGLTLPAGKINVAVNAEIGMTADAAGKPISLAPDVSYGVNDDLTVSLVHSRFATTGFRAAAGGGLCLSGEDNGCAHVYDNVGAEGWYSLARGDLSYAVGGGVHARSLDGGFYALKLGARLRWSQGKLSVISLPSVFVGVTKRETAGVTTNSDNLWLPVVALYRVAEPINVGLGTGFKSPIQKLGDNWEVPLGFMTQYTVNPQLNLGASLVFGKVVGGAEDAMGNSLTGFDYRGVQVWAGYTI